MGTCGRLLEGIKNHMIDTEIYFPKHFSFFSLFLDALFFIDMSLFLMKALYYGPTNKRTNGPTDGQGLV